jgi:hypothetical protein
MRFRIGSKTMLVTLSVADLREIVRAVFDEALGVHARSELLDLKRVWQRYGVGRGSLLGAARRGELDLSLDPRRKFLVRAYEIDHVLTRGTHAPSPAAAKEWTSGNGRPTRCWSARWRRGACGNFRRLNVRLRDATLANKVNILNSYLDAPQRGLSTLPPGGCSPVQCQRATLRPQWPEAVGSPGIQPKSKLGSERASD